MIFNLAFKVILGVFAVAAVAAGGYYATKAYNARSLAQILSERLNSGDYLAALAAAGKLKETGAQGQKLNEQIAVAARLLVAEDAFTKAKQAGEERRYADAGALLRGSAALTDPSFKYFEEAKKLYAEAEAFAASAAHKTAVVISNLAEQAKTEQNKRQALEQSKRMLEDTLSQREQSLSQSKAETAAAKREAETSQKETEVRQAALAAEQARARELMLQVEKESKQKFFTELKVYRDMTQKGREQLDNAVAEINAKRDVTALVYVKQGVSFFEDTRTKVVDMRNNRTPSTYQSHVDDLLRSLEQFIEAAKQFRNVVFLLEDQQSSEFTNGLGKGKTALANAVSLLAGVSDLISANPS